jgi:hypothetical protein
VCFSQRDTMPAVILSCFIRYSKVYFGELT